jgi:trk system potassium uptake protein TrkA
MTPDGLPASRSVIIAGTTRIAAKLAAKLAAENYDVRVLEEDYKKGESFLDAAGPDVNVIQGSSTEEEVLDEAGAANCDVFIGAHANDEKNIISCILAKQRGARKVTALTNKAEYINIVPAIETVDCGFNSSLVAVNKILMILGDKSKIDAMLPRINGCLIEFVINSDSPAKGKKISALNLPMSTVIALVFRKGKAIAATGDLVLERGDIVATIVKNSQLAQIESFFKIKDFFSL